ncbi:hypothetical protein F4779DRAFT_622170 [Xylariaceae sp. FL0662B]|nr:hypothetical protein F4779DRAFT_622170 [Xylariaceae sp. FL0662B]
MARIVSSDELNESEVELVIRAPAADAQKDHNQTHSPVTSDDSCTKTTRKRKVILTPPAPCKRPRGRPRKSITPTAPASGLLSAEEDRTRFKQTLEDTELQYEMQLTTIKKDLAISEGKRIKAESEAEEYKLKLRDCHNGLNNVRAEYDLERTILANDKAELEKEFDTSQSALAESQAKLEDLLPVKTQLSQKDTELERATAALEILRQVFRSTLEKRQVEVEKLECTLNQKNQDIKSITEAELNASKELAATKKQLTNSNTQCELAKKKIGTLEEICKCEKKKVGALQVVTNRQVKELKGDLEKTKTELAAVTNSASTSDKENVQIIHNLKHQNTELRDQQAAIELTMEREKTSYATALANADVTKSNLDKQLLDLQQQLTNQQDTTNSLQRENKELLARAEDREAKIAGLENCIVELEESPGDPGRIQQLEEEIAALKTQVSQLKDVESLLQEAGQTTQALRQHTDNCDLSPEQARWCARSRQRRELIMESWDRRLEDFKRETRKYDNNLA